MWLEAPESTSLSDESLEAANAPSLLESEGISSAVYFDKRNTWLLSFFFTQHTGSSRMTICVDTTNCQM